MNPRMRSLIRSLALTLFFLIITPAAMAADKGLTFGMLLVGPYNDHGWSQAHYEGGRYVEEKIPGAKMIYIDKVNPADRPGITIPLLVEDLVDKGAKLIVANSDDMKDGIREAAAQHPDIKFVHVSGDDVLTGKAPENLSNLMGRMEYGKMMAGFVAGLTSRTGKPRPPDQRGNEAPGGLQLSGCASCLDPGAGQACRGAEIQGVLDRFLVQHSGCHRGSHPGGPEFSGHGA